MSEARGRGQLASSGPPICLLAPAARRPRVEPSLWLSQAAPEWPAPAPPAARKAMWRACVRAIPPSSRPSSPKAVAPSQPLSST